MGESRRLVWLAGLVLVGLALVAIPALAVGLSGTTSVDGLWTGLRLVALEAFTLIFVTIVLGSYRPLFNRVIRPRVVQRLHLATGLIGFFLALAHGLMTLGFGLSGYSRAWWIGPVVLVVLAGVILTALGRRRLRRSWRWVHRLNYFVFAAILVHGLLLGSDLSGGVWLRIWFAVYAAVVLAGLAYRLTVESARRSQRTTSQRGS